jgi:predicted transcriptional regulator
MRVRINVFELKNQLELKERRRYTVQEIAEAVGVTRHTIKEVLNNNSKGMYFDTLVGLIKFFRSKGLSVQIEDILTLEEEGDVVSDVG